MGNRSSTSSASAGSPAERAATTTTNTVTTSIRPSSQTASSSSSSSSSGSSSSYYALLRDSYTSLVHAIIRPPRSQYRVSQLGPPSFFFCERHFRREDFALRNPRGLRIECSLWEPVTAYRESTALPCVIYMHGNSSSRLEALSSLSTVLALGACLLSFDFAGSGLSEGEYVSLGMFEKDDLKIVIEHLRASGRVSTIALWGRSMGAATALLHAERDPSIAGMVLDSSFTDLLSLAQELVEKGREQGLFAPNFVVKLAIKFVRNSVLKAAEFDIKALSPIEKAQCCFVPALFVCASNDRFVQPSHSRRLFEQYGGDKDLMEVEGDHNTARPVHFYHHVSRFLQSTLQIPDEWVSPEGFLCARKLPWSFVLRDNRDKLSPTMKMRARHSSKDSTERQISLDQEIAMRLLEEDGHGNGGYDEEEMIREVQDRLLGLLGGAQSQSDKAHTIRHSEGVSGTPIKINDEFSPFRPSPIVTNTHNNDHTEHVDFDQISTTLTEKEKQHALLRSVSSTLSHARNSEDGSVVCGKDRNEDGVMWVCQMCTLRNPIESEACEACACPQDIDLS